MADDSGAAPNETGKIIKVEFVNTARVKKTGGQTRKRAPKGESNEKPEKVVDWGKFNAIAENFALIYGTDTVWDGTHHMEMKISNMAHAHGSDIVRMWKNSERRRTIMPDDIVFDPTQTCAEGCVNLFHGMPNEPIEGDVQPMLELIKFLLSRISEDEVERDEAVHWLTCWLAHPLQNVGAKMRTAVIMHGDEGAGKNFLFDLVIEIYGKYGKLVGQDELEDKFNDWRSGVLLAVGDEVTSRADLVHNKNRLKSLVTSPTTQINPKGKARREERNSMNIVFLSNELQPLALDNSDRRYFVVYTPRAREFEYYVKLKEWKDAGGMQAFYHYLLNYDLTGFNPSAPAPFTQAKADLIDLNRKSPERFWNDWQAGLLDLPYHSCAVDQAFRAYLKFCQRTGDRFPVPSHIFSKMLLRFAETQGKPVRVKVMQTKETGARTAQRMLLVCEPADNLPQGEWATSCVLAFADKLRKFLGEGWAPPASPTEEDQATRGHP